MNNNATMVRRLMEEYLGNLILPVGKGESTFFGFSRLGHSLKEVSKVGTDHCNLGSRYCTTAEIISSQF
jgi:hypothetical protein